jgi:hypothetical protein
MFTFSLVLLTPDVLASVCPTNAQLPDAIKYRWSFTDASRGLGRSWRHHAFFHNITFNYCAFSCELPWILPRFEPFLANFDPSDAASLRWRPGWASCDVKHVTHRPPKGNPCSLQDCFRRRSTEAHPCLFLGRRSQTRAKRPLG